MRLSILLPGCDGGCHANLARAPWCALRGTRRAERRLCARHALVRVAHALAFGQRDRQCAAVLDRRHAACVASLARGRHGCAGERAGPARATRDDGLRGHMGRHAFDARARRNVDTAMAYFSVRAMNNRLRSLLACAALCASVDVKAHVLSAAERSAPPVLRWTFEPWVVALLIVSLALYVAGYRRLRARSKRGREIRARQLGAFVLGWLMLVAALDSPLD